MAKLMVSIDPGVCTIGWSVWELGARKLLKVGWHELPRAQRLDLDWPAQIRQTAAAALKELVQIDSNTVQLVAVEEPEFRPGSVGGMAAAGRGDVIHLAAAVGFWIGYANSIGRRFRAAPVSEWKGNMDKVLTTYRIRQRMENIGRAADLAKLSDAKKPKHDWDAVGIGLHCMGVEL